MAASNGSATITLHGALTVGAAGLALAVAACDTPPQPRNATAPVAPAGESSQSSGVPAASEGAKSGEGANANAEPSKPMTADEESTSMPQPGQANDHSTLAKDSNS